MLNNQISSTSPSRVKHVGFVVEQVQGNNAAPEVPRAMGMGNRFEEQNGDPNSMPRIPLDVDFKQSGLGNSYGAGPGYQNQSNQLVQSGYTNNGYQDPRAQYPYQGGQANYGSQSPQGQGQQFINNNPQGMGQNQNLLPPRQQGGYGQNSTLPLQQGGGFNKSQVPYFDSQNQSRMGNNFFASQQISQPRKFSNDERYLVKKVLANIVNFLDDDSKEARDLFGKYDVQRVNSISIRDME